MVYILLWTSFLLLLNMWLNLFSCIFQSTTPSHATETNRTTPFLSTSMVIIWEVALVQIHTDSSCCTSSFPQAHPYTKIYTMLRVCSLKHKMRSETPSFTRVSDIPPAQSMRVGPYCSLFLVILCCTKVWIHHTSLNYFPNGRHYGYFQFFVFMNNAAVNIFVHMFLCPDTFISIA